MFILDAEGNTEWSLVARRCDVWALAERWRATTRTQLPAQRRLDEMQRQLAVIEAGPGLLTR